MTIFDDNQRKEVAEETESQQVALRVSAALLGFVAHNSNGGIRVESNINPINLRKEGCGDALEITCDGPNTFRVKESLGLPRVVRVQPRRSAYDPGTLSLSELDRRVMAWVQK